MNRRDWLGLGGCVAIAVLLAVAPHLATLWRYGTFEYITDNDDAFYLAIARAPYYGEPALRDPYSSAQDKVPILFTWLTFVPSAKLTAALGLPPMAQAVVWRIGGAILVTLAFYGLFRVIFAEIPALSRWSLVCTLICISDSGLLGRSFVGNVALIPHLIHGTLPNDMAKGIGLYRVVNPLTNLWAPLVFAACLIPSVMVRRAGVIVGSLALAVCIWSYFYYWTAAVLALGIIVAGSALGYAIWRSKAHLQRAVAGTIIGIVGLGLGSPQILRNLANSQDAALRPTLERQDRGCPIPPGDPERTRYLFNIWIWGKMIASLAVILALKIYRVSPLLIFTAAAFALQCSAVVTGKEYDNFHWGAMIGYPVSEVLVLSLGVLASIRLGWERFAWIAAASLAAFTLVTAAIWRPYEAIKAKEPADYSRLIGEFRPLRPWLDNLTVNDTLAGAVECRAAVLYGRAAQLFMDPFTIHAALISDDEVHQRIALNAWLSGKSREAFAKSLGDIPFSVGPPFRAEWQPEFVSAAQLAWFDKIASGGDAPLMARYHPTVLLIPPGVEPRPLGAWERIAATESWALWKRRP